MRDLEGYRVRKCHCYIYYLHLVLSCTNQKPISYIWYVVTRYTII
jgi:hypothetical protein